MGQKISTYEVWASSSIPSPVLWTPAFTRTRYLPTHARQRFSASLSNFIDRQHACMQKDRRPVTATHMHKYALCMLTPRVRSPYNTMGVNLTQSLGPPWLRGTDIDALQTTPPISLRGTGRIVLIVHTEPDLTATHARWQFPSELRRQRH